MMTTLTLVLSSVDNASVETTSNTTQWQQQGSAITSVLQTLVKPAVAVLLSKCTESQTTWTQSQARRLQLLGKYSRLIQQLP